MNEGSVNSDICTEVLEALQQSLDYLFRDFGFSVTAIEPASSDGRCLIVLSSAQCRLRVVFNRGDLELAVGPSTAPVTWDDTVGRARQWYPVASALYFVRHEKYLSLQELRRPVPFMTLAQKLDRVSADLKPDCEKVVRLFSAEAFPTRQAELDQFLREQNAYLRQQLIDQQRKVQGQ